MIRRLGIFPWGEVIESFLDPLGLTAEDFAERMRGGWLFGYVTALAGVGVSSVIICASERVSRPTRLVHAETGAPVWLVPGRRSGAGRSRRWPSAQAVQQWRLTPLRGFAEILRRESCDSLMAQDYEHPRFDVLALLARGLGLPLFASFQGGDVAGAGVEAMVRGTALRACRGVVAPSARERARLAQRYHIPARRLFDVPNPVDTAFWVAEPRARARAALGIEPQARLVVNHGRIDVWRKGLDVLVEGWRSVAARDPQARLVIIGSGQDHERFAPAIEALPRVTWISDYVTDPERVRRWLSAADLYVSLSRVEGMPVAPLEALACGLPLVASDAHGLADILAADPAVGLQTPRGDPSAAAEAVAALLADSEKRAIAGRRARALAESRFSLPAVGAALADMFARGERSEAAAAADLSLSRLPRVQTELGASPCAIPGRDARLI